MINQQIPNKKNLFFTRVSLGILLLSMIVLLRQVTYHDAGIYLSLFCMLLLPCAAFYLARTAYYRAPEIQPLNLQHSPPTPNQSAAADQMFAMSINDFDLTGKLQYLLHLTNPFCQLKSKAEYAIRLLSELMPDKVFFFYEIQDNRLRFVAGARQSARQVCELVPDGDSLIEELAAKIRGCLDLRTVKITGSFTDILDFSTGQSDKEGLMAPISLYGKFHGIIAALNAGSSPFSNHEKHLIRHFISGFAILLDNHSAFFGQTEEKEAAANRQIAQNLFSQQLPQFAPAIKGWDLAQFTSYASENAGDFHDFINLAGNKMMIIIGKASGSGLNAALFFTRLKVMIHCFSDQSQSPADLLNKLSVKMSSEATNDLFASVIALQIKAGERAATIAIAGQAAPLINRPRSGFVEIAGLHNGVPLGLFNQGVEPYENQSIQLLPGDGILLYTDGVIELPDRNGQNLNPEGLKLELDKISEQTADEILQRLTTGLFPVKGISSYEDYTLIYAKTE